MSRPKGSKNKKSSKSSDGGGSFAVTASVKDRYQPEDPNETEAQADARIRERFNVMHLMAGQTAIGKNTAIIISGPPGLGKSFGVTKICDRLQATGKVVASSVSGFVRPTGLFKALYESREKNQVLILDDADSVFSDEATLNLLKIACDTTKKRTISWLAETRMEDELGSKIPRSFEFQGAVIFITNLDFDALIARGSRLAPHLEALISRSHYLDLSLKTKRDHIVRIKQVLALGMLRDQGMSESDEADVLDFISANVDRLRELSLRMVLKIATLMRINRQSWQKIAAITCMKNA
mgnify:CR=1 FL=1